MTSRWPHNASHFFHPPLKMQAMTCNIVSFLNADFEFNYDSIWITIILRFWNKLNRYLTIKYVFLKRIPISMRKLWYFYLNVFLVKCSRNWTKIFVMCSELLQVLHRSLHIKTFLSVNTLFSESDMESRTFYKFECLFLFIYIYIVWYQTAVLKLNTKQLIIHLHL